MRSSSLPAQSGPGCLGEIGGAPAASASFCTAVRGPGCRAHLSAGELLRTLQPLKVSLLGREVCILAWRFLFLFVVVRDIDPVKHPHTRALESECAVASLGRDFLDLF